MIQWLTNRWKARKLRKARSLFVYFDGRQTRQADPLAVHRAFDLHPKFLWDMGYKIDDGDPEIIQVVQDAVCDVFGLTAWNPVNGTGMTTEDCLSLLWDFCDYLEVQKKNSLVGPTLRERTESESSRATVAQGPDTTSSSDSSLMTNELKREKQPA